MRSNRARFLTTLCAWTAILLVGTQMSGRSHAGIVATATLSSFIQNGSVTNTHTSNLTEVIYTLGTPEDNLATWQVDTAGGTASDFLSDPQYFQTVTFSGLNIAPGGVFNFGSLDIDLILTLVPLNVTGGILGAPTTLRNASLTAKFADGTIGRASLIQQEWFPDQNLELVTRTTAVPEPSTLALGLIAAIAGVGFRARKTARAV